jgi:protein tyrosine phosphatase (PTP) superfamily phosphohydrolase (DUF442 family)
MISLRVSIAAIESCLCHARRDASAYSRAGTGALTLWVSNQRLRNGLSTNSAHAADNTSGVQHNQ